MQVSSNGSYNPSPFTSPFNSPLTSQTNPDPDLQLSQIKNDFNMVSHDLNPSEKRLYDNLVYLGNYEAAKGVIAVGFLRASGLYTDGQNNTLEGTSLSQDLSRLNPPSDPQMQKSLSALQDHLNQNPTAMLPDAERRGNFIDLKI